MFDTIKAAILRDVKTAAESKCASSGPRDALIHHYLLLEACERLDRMQKAFADLAITMHMRYGPSSVENRDASWPDDLSMVYCFSCKGWHHPSVPHRAKEEELVKRESTTWKGLDRLISGSGQEAQQHNTGMMLAFFLDPEAAQQLAIPGGEAPEDLHITLCFLGSVEDFTGDIEYLKEVVARFAASNIPLGGVIDGIGRFVPSESSDRLSPIIALVNMPGLQSWRQRLARVLDDNDIFVADDFDYLPHVTLAYVDPEATMPVTNIASLPLSFDTIWLCIGGERIPYRLGGPLPRKEEVATLSNQTYCYKVEALDKDGNTLETDLTPTQSNDTEPAQPTRSDEEASIGALRALHDKEGAGDADIRSDATATGESDMSGREGPNRDTQQVSEAP